MTTRTAPSTGATGPTTKKTTKKKTTTTYLRARQPEQKQQRKAALLLAARAALEGDPDGGVKGAALADLSLNALARRAGMTKSNTYRYFESREHVLLELLQEEWLAWMSSMSSMSSSWPATTTPAALAQTLASSVAARPLLCELTTALPAVLEQNLGVDAIIGFKRATLGFFKDAGAALSARAPFLSSTAASQLMADLVTKG